jgi:hypothetical protein
MSSLKRGNKVEWVGTEGTRSGRLLKGVVNENEIPGEKIKVRNYNKNNNGPNINSNFRNSKPVLEISKNKLVKKNQIYSSNLTPITNKMSRFNETNEINFGSPAVSKGTHIQTNHSWIKPRNNKTNNTRPSPAVSKGTHIQTNHSWIKPRNNKTNNTRSSPGKLNLSRGWQKQTQTSSSGPESRTSSSPGKLNLSHGWQKQTQTSSSSPESRTSSGPGKLNLSRGWQKNINKRPQSPVSVANIHRLNLGNNGNSWRSSENYQPELSNYHTEKPDVHKFAKNYFKLASNILSRLNGRETNNIGRLNQRKQKEVAEKSLINLSDLLNDLKQNNSVSNKEKIKVMIYRKIGDIQDILPLLNVDYNKEM